MSTLSDTPGAPAIYGTNRKKHVPYSCWLRVEPLPGKRFERIRDIEKQANNVETALAGIECEAGTEDLPFDFTKPVAFTRQFGNKPARLSFEGHLCVLIAPNTIPKAIIGESTVVNAGEFKTGYGAAHRADRFPDPELDDLVKDFKDLIETTTGLTVIRLEVARVIYGLGGFHFPR